MEEINFKDLIPEKQKFSAERRIFASLINKEFYIKDFIKRKSNFSEGDFAVILCEDAEGEFTTATSSKVILDNLEKMKDALSNKIKIKVTLKIGKTEKGRKYYYFE